MQTHLYRRAATDYWRRLVPTTYHPILGSRDLRASLRTNLPETARSRARRMDAALDLALRELEKVMRAGQVLSEAQKSAIVREIRRTIIEHAEDQRLAAGIRVPEEIEAAVAKALRLPKSVRDLIARNDFDRGGLKLDPMLARDGISLDKQGPEYHRGPGAGNLL